MLKSLYFGGTSDADCAYALRTWAERHGIDVTAERRAVGPVPEVWFVRFHRRG